MSYKLSSRQRKAQRLASGQTALAIRRHNDDARELVRLASGKCRPIGKQTAKQAGKAIRANIRASQFEGSGKWTSFPFHHGRTFIRKSLADKASRYPL